jgi:phosphomannomutase
MKNLILFDVDGTLTKSRLTIEAPMKNMIFKLKQIDQLDIGIVGGSNFPKQEEQLGSDVLRQFDWVFSENGLMAFKNNKLINKASIENYLGNAKICELIDCVLECFSKIKLPVKRGTFIDFRNGMINICPVGRSCSQEERKQFCEMDKNQGIRKKIVTYLNKKLSHLDLSYSIGGEISIDVFPKGWDKTYCLQFIESHYNTIYFFGDRTMEGGNDFEIYSHSRTQAYSVNNPNETINLLNKIFF